MLPCDLICRRLLHYSVGVTCRGRLLCEVSKTRLCASSSGDPLPAMALRVPLDKMVEGLVFPPSQEISVQTTPDKHHYLHSFLGEVQRSEVILFQSLYMAELGSETGFA